MRKILAILQRELYEFRAGRTLATLGLFAVLQLLLMLGSKTIGRLESTLLLFQLGGVMALVLCFDSLAREREHHTLDLLLTGGLPRSHLFAARWLAALGWCLVCALVLVLATGLGSWIKGQPFGAVDLLVMFAMIFWLLSVYGLLALACSVVCRRGKWALIAAVIAWVVLRPPVQALLVIGPLGWGKQQVWSYLAWLPDFAFRMGLDPARSAPQGVIIQTYVPYLALGLACVGLTLLGWGVFSLQDEPAI